MVSAAEAAPQLGVSPTWLRQLAAEQRVPHYRIPGRGRCRYTFDVDELRALWRVEATSPLPGHQASVQRAPVALHVVQEDEDPDWDSIAC